MHAPMLYYDSLRPFGYQLEPLSKGLTQDMGQLLDVSQYYVEIEGKRLQIGFQHQRLLRVWGKGEKYQHYR